MKSLLLLLTILFSIFSQAQTPKEWVNLAGKEFRSFLDYEYKLTKDNATGADIDSLQSHIQIAETYIQQILNYNQNEFGIRYKTATAKYFQVVMQYELGVFFMVIDHKQQALDVFKKLEGNRNMSVFSSAVLYPLSYWDGDTYTIDFNVAKYYPGKLYTAMASIYHDLSETEQAAHYYEWALSQEHLIPWYRYVNSTNLIIYKINKHEEDAELMNYYLINLQSFEGFTSEDYSNIEKQKLSGQEKMYDLVNSLLDRHPELSSSGSWHLKIGKIFYDKEDYQRATNCFKKNLAEDNATPNYYGLGDAAHAAMKINDKEMVLMIIDRIRTKSYKLEADCSLLQLLYDCYIHLGMTSEAKSYEKKISKCPKLEKREKIKDRNYYRKLDRY